MQLGFFYTYSSPSSTDLISFLTKKKTIAIVNARMQPQIMDMIITSVLDDPTSMQASPLQPKAVKKPIVFLKLNSLKTIGTSSLLVALFVLTLFVFDSA